MYLLDLVFVAVNYALVSLSELFHLSLIFCDQCLAVLEFIYAFAEFLHLVYFVFFLNELFCKLLNLFMLFLYNLGGVLFLTYVFD